MSITQVLYWLVAHDRLSLQGWNYWYNWVIILPAELSAAAILINYWNHTGKSMFILCFIVHSLTSVIIVNNAAWITICLVVVVVINMFGAGVYGECEFIFA